VVAPLRPDQTEWAVSALPLGGYVKMLDAREADRATCRRKTCARIHPPERVEAHRHRGRRPAGQFPDRDLLLYMHGRPVSVRPCWDTCTMTLKMIGKMITGEVSLKNVTGPITIADYAGQTARIGFRRASLSFIAFISISLGVMNLLPIPVLDGGHLLYYSLEVLTGRPCPRVLARSRSVPVWA
jgi:membrane-associated protease RseP (regulator of RpoE activity)